MIKFPYSKPHINKADKNSIMEVLKSGYLTQGIKLQKFESELKKEFNSKYAVAVNSGTAALHLLYKALGLSSKNALLTSPITFLATANAARMCGAKVLFSDTDPITGLMTPKTVEKAIIESNYKIKVITVVHLGGRVCDLPGIARIAKKYNCYVVDDACHAPGARYTFSGKEIRVGSSKHTIASTFSFHAIKHIAVGEGGAVLTNNKRISEKILSLRNHSMIKESRDLLHPPEKRAPWYYEVHDLGYNYRLDEMSCALGISQLKRLHTNIRKRWSLIKSYQKKLRKNNFIVTPAEEKIKYSHVWHLYSILIDFDKLKLSRGELMMKLEEEKIGTQVHYIPLFLQPYYHNSNHNYLSNALSYYNKTLSLPLYTQLKLSDIDYICKHINSIIYKYAK